MLTNYLFWLAAAIVLYWVCRSISEEIHLIVFGLTGLAYFLVGLALTPWPVQLLLIVAAFIYRKNYQDQSQARGIDLNSLSSEQKSQGE